MKNEQQNTEREAARFKAYIEFCRDADPELENTSDVERAFFAGFDAGDQYEPPDDPHFNELLAGAVENINNKYRREGYAKGYNAALKERGADERKCPDCGFAPLDYSDDDVITCWRCDAQEYMRMYLKATEHSRGF